MRCIEVMKAAFTEWHGRVAPVFDVAQTVLMVETERSGSTTERVVGLPAGFPSVKVAYLADQGVEVLVCGAISRAVRMMAAADNILVHPFVSGDIRDVVDAWMHDRLDEVRYSMPGCRRCRRQLRERSGQKVKYQGGTSCHEEIKPGRREQAP